MTWFSTTSCALTATEENVPIICHWIRRTPELGFGTVFNNEEPWQAKKVKERLGELERKLAALRKVPQSSGDAYRDKVKDFYSDLRETWERLVEELLLNDVVGRFQRDVATLFIEGRARQRRGLSACLLRDEEGIGILGPRQTVSCRDSSSQAMTRSQPTSRRSGPMLPN